MIPFAPGFFKPYIAAAPVGLTARLYDEFVGTNGAAIAGRTPDVGGNWSTSDIGFGDWEGEILNNTAIIVHDGSGDASNAAGHRAALSSSWSVGATLKFKISIDFIVNEVFSTAWGSGELALATTLADESAFPSANGFQLRLTNIASATDIQGQYEVRKAGTLKQSDGATFTPNVGSSNNITVEYDASTGDVVFSINGSTISTKTLAHTDLPATIAYGAMRIATARVNIAGGGLMEHRMFAAETVEIAFDS